MKNLIAHLKNKFAIVDDNSSTLLYQLMIFEFLMHHKIIKLKKIYGFNQWYKNNCDINKLNFVIHVINNIDQFEYVLDIDKCIKDNGDNETWPAEIVPPIKMGKDHNFKSIFEFSGYDNDNYIKLIDEFYGRLQLRFFNTAKLSRESILICIHSSVIRIYDFIAEAAYVNTVDNYEIP